MSAFELIDYQVVDNVAEITMRREPATDPQIRAADGAATGR